jgi:nitroreductase
VTSRREEGAVCDDLDMTLDLTPDELLATTRSVRKRLDLTRPVEREVLEDCLRLAQQAPTASYAQNWHFVVVTDAGRRAALGELWRGVAAAYLEHRSAAAAGDQHVARIGDAVRHLADHIHEVPVHVIPCVEGRTDGAPAMVQASRWASIIPAAWSFMLAARARGLGTVWTTFHLRHERDAAEILGIPYDQVMQAALIPVAYTIGTELKPAARRPLDTLVHWDQW